MTYNLIKNVKINKIEVLQFNEGYEKLKLSGFNSKNDKVSNLNLRT
jgi:hypothetical protein